MKRCILTLCLLFAIPPAVRAQSIGVPSAVDLSSGSASLNLNFSLNDYEMILYSNVTSEPDTARTYAYTVSFPGSAKWAAPRADAPITTDRDRLESRLRRKEHALAQWLRSQGGGQLPARKTSAQAADTRTFNFGAFGGVTTDQSVTATRVAENTRAIGYLDNALNASDKNIGTADIQAMLDRFSTSTYATVTGMFGAPSDVDGNGKVIFLFTPLVDKVGGVAGFYSASALFAKPQGDGNQADMMFISPTRALTTYESLLAHEFQHLINFNQHVLIAHGDAEDAWLNEGLSHVTEDLVGGHISGGNPDLINEFMQAPERVALTGDAEFNQGIRGAAYLFVRGLMEDFGSDAPGRLVKTDRVGTANVENVTGHTFEALLQSYMARLYLSGTGLNADAAYNYTYRYLTEPQTKRRSLPVPGEHRLASQSFSGAVKPAAASFVRLTGSGTRAVQIQADLAGRFNALIIPIPKDFTAPVALPTDYFEGLTLDAPFPGVFTSGESATISGAVADTSVGQVLISFTPQNGPAGSEIKFSTEVAGGRFSASLVFASSQAGTYNLGVFAGKANELLPGVGTFPGVVVKAGTGPVTLPIDYFSGITLDAPLPTQFTAGAGVSFSGKTTDAGIDVLLLVFTEVETGNKIRVQTGVTDGAFRKGFVFTPAQAGAYTLDVYGGPSGGSLPGLGTFSPVTVTATGNDLVRLPVDLFDQIVLDAPLSTTFYVGQTRQISGQVTGSDITQIAIGFAPASGGASIDEYAAVANGRFTANVAFTSAQTGQYELAVYGGSGQSLPSLGAFSPINVVTARPTLSLATRALTWPEIETGHTGTQALTIANTGSLTLDISSIAAPAPFSATPDSLTIAPGDSQTVTLTFAPTASGTFTDALTLTTNDPDHTTVSVVLTASATAPSGQTPSPDFDGNGTVDFSDFIAFAGVFGTHTGSPGFDARFDLDSNGAVGFSDFIIFAGAFGKPVGG